MSCGRSGTGETPQVLRAEEALTARPAESEYPEAEITPSHYTIKKQQVCENSFYIYSSPKISMSTTP
jgi:hypothetical protein